MALLALAIPMIPEKRAQWEQFVEQLSGTKKSEFNESRRRLGVRERTFHQVTSHGELVVVTLEGENPGAFMQQFATSDDPFSRWFVEQVKEIHGVDLSQPMPGPMPRLLVDTGAS
ncbi:MAG: hypothetical protein HY329_24245 [Chloroflexi bacterium]|nr:hypothetical protein [Chloroflexota bacterium]